MPDHGELGEWSPEVITRWHDLWARVRAAEAEVRRLTIANTRLRVELGRARQELASRPPT